MRHSANCFTFLFFLIALLFACSSAGADIFRPDVEEREFFSLDGVWKFAASDSSDYAAPDFDHSAWSEAQVPGTWRISDISSPHTAWYRRTFRLPAGHNYGWLRIADVSDEAEVWLNGEKLINPLYQAPLEDRQAGVYQGLWHFDWPNYFMVTRAIIPGGENTIAIRVSYDSTSRNSVSIKGEQPGKPGIPGEVFLIGHPDIYISSIERDAPRSLSADRKASHSFHTVIGNMSLQAEKGSVSFFIIDSDGNTLFEKTVEKDVQPGGDILEFQWQTDPSIEKYTARVKLKNHSGGSDSAELSFHGTLVTVAGSIVVNGDKYRVKGVEGTPGMTTTASARLAISEDAARDEIRKLAAAGVNTLRIPDPPGFVIDLALDAGILVIPLLTNDWARTVVALREYPGILYWDLEMEDERELLVASETIRALDPYHRPIAYSGAMQELPGAMYSRSISITGINAYGSPGDMCSDSSPELKEGRPVVLVNWSMPPAGWNPDHELLAAEPRLRELWNNCAKRDFVRGAVFSGITDEQGFSAGLRDAGTLEWHRFAADVLLSLFNDFETEYISKDDRISAVEFHLLAPFVQYDLNVYSQRDKALKQISRSDPAARGQFFRTPVSSRGGVSDTLLIRYTTHGGLQHELLFNPDDSEYSPATISMDGNEAIPKNGGEVTFKISGGQQPMKASLQVKVGASAVVIPTVRGVFIPANDSVEAPFRITPSETGETTLTTTLQFSDPPGKKVHTYFPVVIE